jgi:hypothetical protein
MGEARINPKHRATIDFERLAEAILAIAAHVDDEEMQELGHQIRLELEAEDEGAA